MLEGKESKSVGETLPATTPGQPVESQTPPVTEPGIFEKLTTPLFGPYKRVYEIEKNNEAQKKVEQTANTERGLEKNIVTQGATLKRLASIVWQSARSSAIIQGVASVVESAATMGSFYFGARLFRSFESIFQGGAPGNDLTQNLVIMVGLGAVAAYTPFSRLVSTIFHSKMQVRFSGELMKAISNHRQNELETEALRKEITTVRENTWRLPQLTMGMLQSAGKTVELTFAGSLLSYVAFTQVNPASAVAMAGLLVVATVPRMLSEYRHAKDVLQVEENISDLRRKSWFLGYFATENSNVRELKNLGREEEIQERALGLVKETLDGHIDAEKRNATQQLYSYAITRGTALGCVGVFVARAVSGELAPEVLGIAVGALYRFEGALSSISSIIGEQLKHFQFAQRTVGLIVAGEKSAEAENLKRTESLPWGAYPAPIRLEDVQYTYHGKTRPAVSGVNLTIVPGEFVAIVGPNGCGKTTLSKLLRGTYPPETGVVAFGSVNLEHAKLEDLNSYIASTGQDGLLFESLAIKESIELGAPMARAGIEFNKALQLGLAEEFLGDLRAGVNTIIGSGFENGQELSSGQKQMVLASRTFRREPRVMLLDEPGSNLDPQHDAQLASNLDSFKSGECTRILITHNLRAAARRADRIIVMEGGTISDQGSHTELMERNAWYRASYEIQENGGNDNGKLVVNS